MLAALQGDTLIEVTKQWRELATSLGWDGVDYRFRLDEVPNIKTILNISE